MSKRGARDGAGRDLIVCGIHAVRQVLADAPEHALELWIETGPPNPRLRDLQKLAAQHGLAVQRAASRTLDRLAAGVRHQGAVLRCRHPRAPGARDLKSLLAEGTAPPLLLVLDGVQDPHNLGACLRTADGAGAHAVIVPLHRAVGLTLAVQKVASGAAATVPLIQVGNLAAALEEMKDLGLQVIGTAGAANDSLFGLDLRGPTALVMGGEEKGLRRLTRERCDRLVHIPMSGAIESLNVSVAAGICLYEAVRQRRGLL
ncbi:MAG: 23S rRNA (guanosine(2251)-2'-O)-methyltransferase RlmB [Gammaproteobacteria bacterium]